MYCFPVDFLQEAMGMSMVSGDKPNFCSCSWTSGILAALGFCEVDVVSRVSQVIGGGVWWDGELTVAPRTSVWLGETKLVSASWARSGFPMLGPPEHAEEMR